LDIDSILELVYHIRMQVSRQLSEPTTLKGASARTWKLMVATAREMMQQGQSPSVSEVAEQAEVSRSTAYRYFPTRAAMVQAVVGETLGPILDWDSDKHDPVERVAELIEASVPAIAKNEVTFRAALRVALESDDTEAVQNGPLRGHRVELLQRALSPLPQSADKDRLIQVLSVLFGVEGLVVLRDICGLDSQSSQDVIAWAAQTLVLSVLDDTA
jgi:AcrR family transcriptional regulator